jgi:UDP-N-acetylglucosamine 3-dehydrogenase
MSKKIKVAVIGLGNMGKHHARNYFEISEAELVAVCDVQESVAQQYAEQFACKAYTSIETMLQEEDMDALSITAPTVFHYDIAKICLQYNVSLLIEKPICESVEKAEEIISIAKQKNLTLMVGHIERFNPAVQKLKELIDAGELGKVTSLISRRVGVFPAQIKDTNVIIDLAVHDIDIMSSLLEKQPDAIYGNAGRALINGREDYADILLTYGDQSALMQVNWITPLRIRHLAVTGTKGYAELNYMTQELKVYESVISKEPDNFGDFTIKFGAPIEHVIDVEKKEPLKSELSHFINCVLEKKTPLISGEVGLQALDTALKVMDVMNIKK